MQVDGRYIYAESEVRVRVRDLYIYIYIYIYIHIDINSDLDSLTIVSDVLQPLLSVLFPHYYPPHNPYQYPHRKPIMSPDDHDSNYCAVVASGIDKAKHFLFAVCVEVSVYCYSSPHPKSGC